MSYLLESLTKKVDVDKLILNTIDKVLVLRVGRASDVVCMQLGEILGAYAILAVSLAICKVGVGVLKIPLYQIVMPVLAFNVINGGSHAGIKLAMQEIMILPTGASSFIETMLIGTEVYHNLKAVIKPSTSFNQTFAI